MTENTRPSYPSLAARIRARAVALVDRAEDRWYAFPVRWQILVAIALLTLLTGLVGGVIAVLDSRGRAAVETQSNVELWRHHIAAQAREIDTPADVAPFAWRLSQEMAQVRHVTIRILDKNGAPLSEGQDHRAADRSHDRESAPVWFVQLAKPDKVVETVPLVARGEGLGTVIIEGEPDDEIAEAWELLEMMAILWLGGTLLTMTGLYFVLGYVLDPLVTLSQGMHELEDGHYGLRLEPPKVRELSAIVGSFNTLAEALDKANAENSRLYRQLVVVQEDERRQISRDLHDEFGPCLFGITAGTGAIERHARSLPEPQSAAILSCVREIALVSERMKSINRSLLNRLRPVALGRITLAELIGELVLSFERRHPDTRFEREIGDLPASLGEDVDLTLYRCVQEGLTNAVRHGRPTSVTVALNLEEAGSGPSTQQCVRLRITDDGIGISDSAAPGYGLAGMRERVRALSGDLVIEKAVPKGTTLRASLPVSAAGAGIDVKPAVSAG